MALTGFFPFGLPFSPPEPPLLLESLLGFSTIVWGLFAPDLEWDEPREAVLLALETLTMSGVASTSVPSSAIDNSDRVEDIRSVSDAEVAESVLVVSLALKAAPPFKPAASRTPAIFRALRRA